MPAAAKAAEHDLCFRMDKWPRRQFADECQGGGFLAETVKARTEGQWPAFCRELFGRLYGVGCTPLDKPVDGAEWAGELHTQADAVPEWRSLFGATQGDSWRSALVASAAANVLAEHMPSLPEENADALQQEREGLADLSDELQLESGELEQRIGDLEARAQAARDASQAATEQLRSGQGFATRSALRKAANAAAEALQQVDDAMTGFGAGAGTEVSALAKRAMLKTIVSDDRVRRIAALAGRLRVQAAQKQRTKVTQERREVVSVTKGDDLQRLLASEAGLLCSQVTRPFVLERIDERRALQYELGGKDTMTRGPIVFLIDKSSSMGLNRRDEWACACALAIAEIARIQKRPFAIAFFNAAIAEAFYFDVGDTSFERIMQVLAVRPSGGTVIANALEWAHGIVAGTTAPAQWPHGKKSDVILVTDGDDTSDVTTPIDKLKSVGASVYTLAIECEPGHALRAASTEVVRIVPADMTGANARLDGVFSI